MQIELTDSLARAIIAMDNIAWSEGLGPNDLDAIEWDELLVNAEMLTGIASDRTNYFAA